MHPCISNGLFLGHLSVEMYPCKSNGDLITDDYVDNPQELVSILSIPYSDEYTHQCEHQKIRVFRSKSMSLRGIPELAVSFLMRADRAFLCTQLTKKMANCDFGPVPVKSCERALFFVYIWIVSWDATNKALLQR